MLQLIPPEIKWDPDATPPQYTDNADQVIEKGTNLRIKLIGLRSDVGAMYAIGSIKEDYLGSVIYILGFPGNLLTRVMLIGPFDSSPASRFPKYRFQRFLDYPCMSYHRCDEGNQHA
jgi:hypothetical protein